MTVRMLSDNILVRLEPPPSETASGIALVHTRAPGVKEHRDAVVIAAGPGHHPGCKSCGGQKPAFIPMTLRPGDRIVVEATAGHRYEWDVSGIRHNEKADFDSMLGERGDYRVIRIDEALAVYEDEAKAAE